MIGDSLFWFGINMIEDYFLLGSVECYKNVSNEFSNAFDALSDWIITDY